MKYPVLLKRSPIAKVYPLPGPAVELDVGHDLYLLEDYIIKPQEVLNIWHGIYIGLPDYLWARIEARSSTIGLHKLLVVSSPIDPGYRGQIGTQVLNFSNTHMVRLKRGDRISQITYYNRVEVEYDLNIPDDFNKTERGQHGMGHTGA